MTAQDPTTRFSSRVEDYARYRPSYPAELIPFLERECGLRPGMTVADVGSGTGLLAELFLKFGCQVIGVEPNREMREAGDRHLGAFPGFRSVNARAEDTTLPPSSIDLVTAGQAFHWFDPGRTRLEFRRVLKPGGHVVLVWNERLVSGDRFLEGYERLLHRYAAEYPKVDHRRIDSGALDALFGHSGWRSAIFQNQQRFDWSGVLGRLRSSSYVPRQGTAEFENLITELEPLFDASQRNGVVEFPYETKLYCGTIDQGAG